MELRCTQCLTEIPERLSYETPRGEILCGPCYFALWRPRDADELHPASEARRPESLRPRRGRSIWMPGPTGELDPEEPVRRRRPRG